MILYKLDAKIVFLIHKFIIRDHNSPSARLFCNFWIMNCDLIVNFVAEMRGSLLCVGVSAAICFLQKPA